MRKNRAVRKGLLLVAALALVLVFVQPAAAEDDTYTTIVTYVQNYDRFGQTWHQFLEVPQERQMFEQDMITHFGDVLTPAQVTTFTDFLATNDEAGAYTYLYGIFSVGVTPSSPSSAPQKTASVVMRNVILPPVQTQQAKRQESGPGARFIGGDVRMEWVSTDDAAKDGNIPGVTLGMAFDTEDFSWGFLIPYDHMDMDLYNADRVGAILFGQYGMPVGEMGEAAMTVYGDYMYFDPDKGENINYYGGGVGFSYTMDRGIWVPGIAIGYQFTADDSDISQDKQHLVKLGANVGIRTGDRAVVNLFGFYNNDMTSDVPQGFDNTFYDAGAEVGYSITDTWGLNFGYKKVFGITNYDSDMVYLGTVSRW